MVEELKDLAEKLDGELKFDNSSKINYATDASAYREIPLAVAFPKNESDIQLLLEFANNHSVGIIPRTAGTSLAGQVVGNGIVVDVSRYFTSIIELNKEEKWVRVQPGVIRDELNYVLKPQGFLFGPETSTSNRAMIGGMIGNNSCGSNSLAYGSTRDHLIEVQGYLSNGKKVQFKDLSKEEFKSKLELPENDLEGNIYRKIFELLSDEQKRDDITNIYPKPTINRRNTGYALDILMDASIFNNSTQKFNFCNLIAGSEGTLAFITEAKLKITSLPPKFSGLLVPHFHSLEESFHANIVALKYAPYAVELIDHHILDCTIGHPLYEKHRFFIEEEPKSILAIQLHANSEEELDLQSEKLIDDLKANNFGYHYPLLKGGDISKVWSLRKAGLGLLANIPGDEKAVPVIEDTCVDVHDLPNYIKDFNEKLRQRELSCVYYAHIGTGELHLRPMINLKTTEGVKLFKDIAQDIADLVKKYNGSLSGEHGDGRLRGEFIPQMVGSEIFQDFLELKSTWDPNNILNPGKIVHTPSMNTSLRYEPNQKAIDINTAFDFSKNGGFLETVELCNGSADCRKTELTGGIMCPSYMATRDEAHTTRARANTLRELMTQKQEQAFQSTELEKSMELCLMCKGCKIECPSNVDMATYKSEFLYQKSKHSRKTYTQKKMAHFSKSMELMKSFYPVSKWVASSSLQNLIKNQLGIAKEREIPIPEKQSLFQWYNTSPSLESKKTSKGKVYLMCDEFTNYLDVNVGKCAILLLLRLGYEVELTKPIESARTAISKGYLDEAKTIIQENINYLSEIVSSSTPLLGVEPSTLLALRDEYLNLSIKKDQAKTEQVSNNSWLIEEFLCHEFDKGKISENNFTNDRFELQFHGHCHQKSLSNVSFTKKLLNIPKNVKASIIPSGCCGMAGSFGYEQYEVSMKIGELVLFPAVKNKADQVITIANGTSCRQQIKDGTQVKSLHPVEFLMKVVR